MQHIIDPSVGSVTTCKEAHDPKATHRQIMRWFGDSARAPSIKRLEMVGDDNSNREYAFTHCVAIVWFRVVRSPTPSTTNSNTFGTHTSTLLKTLPRQGQDMCHQVSAQITRFNTCATHVEQVFETCSRICWQHEHHMLEFMKILFWDLANNMLTITPNAHMCGERSNTCTDCNLSFCAHPCCKVWPNVLCNVMQPLSINITL